LILEGLSTEGRQMQPINHGVIGTKPSRREETHATVAPGQPKWRRELFQALAVEGRKVHLTEPDIDRTPADFRRGALLPRGRRSIYVGGRAIEALARLGALVFRRWARHAPRAMVKARSDTARIIGLT
jgi:hypothetical protein